MRNYRPLFLQNLDVRLPGMRVRRLRLNRHLPDVDSLARHSHGFSQILCYLSGKGMLHLDEGAVSIAPGSVVFLPPKAEHSFQEVPGRRPLCLVVDFEWRGSSRRPTLIQRLTQSNAFLIRQALAELTRLQNHDDASNRLIVASLVLRILDGALRGLGFVTEQKPRTSPLQRRIDAFLDQSEEALPEVTELARALGYNADHLNRIFKTATGQTLREYRDSRLVAKAKRYLVTTSRVQEVCDAIGFEDPNYFSRWFRRQTGDSPLAYKRSAIASPRAARATGKI